MINRKSQGLLAALSAVFLGFQSLSYGLVGSAPHTLEGITELSPQEVYQKKDHLKVIDVRRPDEFNNELGHIPGAIRVTLGEQLTNFLQSGNKEEEIVFVCRSGTRSAQATAESVRKGYKFTASMSGGMIRWNEEGLPVEKK